MSMRTYGVQTKGMVFELTDFQRLINSNVKGIIDSGILEKMGIKNITSRNDLDLIDLLDFTDIIDFIYEIDFATFIGEFDGYLETDLEKNRTYYNNDDIILLELRKDTLYDKYNDRAEIIAELKDDLKKVGIVVDNDYINKHFGYLNGSFCC